MDLHIGDTLLETVEQGGIFSELALVDAAPRSATAVAGPDCTLKARPSPAREAVPIPSACRSSG